MFNFFLILFFFLPKLGAIATQFPSMDVIYHPVSTKNVEVQKIFNTGLTAYFAFDYQGAYLFFKKCSEIEPNLAMAYWGMAIATEKIPPESEEINNTSFSLSLVRKAESLLDNISSNEIAYIKALAEKFSVDTDEKTNLQFYSEAMKNVVASFPDDLDAAVFFAESLLEKEGWVMWKDGNPKPDAELVVEVLESVLKRDPNHIGANHYYIHTMENANDLMSAMISANYLYHVNTEWGHLVHSASHIFLPLGYYNEAVEANIRAIKIDKEFASHHPEQKKYRQLSEKHESFYLWMGYLWEDNYKKSLETAKQIEKLVIPLLEQHPDAENDLLLPFKTMIYFHKWDEILNEKKPDSKLFALNLLWHFSKAMGFLGTNKIVQAKEEIGIYKSNLEKFKSPVSFYQFKLADGLLDSTLEYAQGNINESIDKLYDLVEKQDKISWLEWFYPFRLILGARLIEAGYYEDAEMVFRKCLSKLPRNGRALLGLAESLKLQNKDSFWIEREAFEALKYSDNMRIRY